MSGKTHVCRPIPALYTVYVLRSTVRHASLYIGSTPNPPRRLKQHNGECKGGAARTSRDRLRPWEMVTLVSGFPSMVAALKFEWALTNPHLSLHIPEGSRLTISSQTKRNGMPKRPRHSMKSIISNIHLLAGVPSFSRWPLNVHFMAEQAFSAWQSRVKATQEIPTPNIRVSTDFPDLRKDQPGDSAPASGVHALPLDYTPMIDYVAKSHDIVAFEQEGRCVHCSQQLESGQELHAICPESGCKATGHLDCWSKYALLTDHSGHIVPLQCSCPSCGSEIRWGDMVKELSLRVRGVAEVEKILKNAARLTKKNEEQTATGSC